jgi:hypothetical protein
MSPTPARAFREVLSWHLWKDVLHCDKIRKPGLADRLKDIAIVDLAGAWLVAAGHIAHMEYDDRIPSFSFAFSAD